MDLFKALSQSAAGMRAQGVRMRIIAENVANSSSTATSPGGLPYRRKLVTFENALDRELNVDLVRVGDVAFDQSDFGRRFDPGHPAADPEGYVLMPNVQVLLEMADMREAQRSYQANLEVIRSSRRMLQRTIDILRR